MVFPVSIGRCMLIWADEHGPNTFSASVLEKLRASINEVQVENADRLLVSHPVVNSINSVVIVFGGVCNEEVCLSSGFLSMLLKVLVANAQLFFLPTGSKANATKADVLTKLASNLVLAGFKVVETIEHHANFGSPCIVAQKPAFEIGSSEPLNFGIPKKDDVKKAWTLSADDMMDSDLINEDELLTADDYLVPDINAVNACDPDASKSEKKRKACKNCTCGFADEVEKENTSQPVKSSCGSCYLGDAFRCSSCPYSGMPPFKPGDKVQLSSAQLKNDI